MAELDARELRVTLPVSGPLVDLAGAGGSNDRGLTVTNISRTGMFVATSTGEKLPPGESVQFALKLDQDQPELRGVAKVKWVRGRELGPHLPQGAGVKFLEFQGDGEFRYLEFLEARLRQLTVSELMDRHFVALEPAMTTREAVARLVAADRDAAVIVDRGGAPLGVITRREFAAIMLTPGALEQSVFGRLLPMPLVFSPKDSPARAFEWVRRGAARFFPVVEAGRVIGVISTREIARFLTESMELAANRSGRMHDHSLAVIAHDLRTPISVVQAANALLVSGAVNVEEYVAAGLPAAIAQSCDTLGQLVGDILDLGRLKAGAMRFNIKPVDIGSLAQQLTPGLKAAAGARGVDFRVEIRRELPLVRGDEVRLQQIINNLVNNAIKFSPPGGRVSLRIGLEGSEISLAVIDQGPGIAAADQAKLFRDYSQLGTKPCRDEQGCGLGLAIVRRLVGAHGGSIRLVSKVGSGSQFIVYLPVAN